MSLLDGAANLFGPLAPDVKARLMAFIERPSFETWDEAYSIIVEPRRMTTVWGAVATIAPEYAHIGKSHRDPAAAADRWKKFPDPLLVARAIKAVIAGKA